MKKGSVMLMLKIGGPATEKKTNRIIPRLLCLTFAGILVTNCSHLAHKPNTATGTVSESKILSLYDQLKIGMTREQVEAIVGKPLWEPFPQSDFYATCHYIDKPERPLTSHESPWSFSGLVITYRDGRLIDKKYNFQWVKQEHIEAYEQMRAEDIGNALGTKGQ
jgi:hypothetical protein